MFFKEREPSLLKLEVDRAIRHLKRDEVGSEDYEKTLNSLIKIHQLKEQERPLPVSKDTLVLVATNLLGIIMIIKHEHVNVITSRAMNLVLKPK
jgi:hypothetical protein